MRRVKVLSAFFALAMFVQLGYYFDFIEFVDTNKSPLHDFHLSSFPSSSPSLLAPLHALCNRTKWKPNTYINCSNISTPAFAAINQFQVLFIDFLFLKKNYLFFHFHFICFNELENCTEI